MAFSDDLTRLQTVAAQLQADGQAVAVAIAAAGLSPDQQAAFAAAVDTLENAHTAIAGALTPAGTTATSTAAPTVSTPDTGTPAATPTGTPAATTDEGTPTDVGASLNPPQA